MLGLTTRMLCGAALVWLLGCDNTTPGKPITGSKSHADDADGGEEPHKDVPTDHHVAVGSAGTHGSTDADDAGMDDHSTKKPDSMPAKSSDPGQDKGSAGKAGAKAANGGVGGARENKAGASGRGGAGGAGGSDADDSNDGEPDDGKGNAGDGAAGSGGTRDPRDILWDFAKRTPQGMAADIIRRYLDDLGSGDTPASSVKDFLHSIDDEAHCTQMISQECVAACSVVTRTCGVCVLDEDCRSELLRVCGVGALACGR